jgi:hypothetical protein
MSAAYCPKCGLPLLPQNESDNGCLCETCGWFGDAHEVLAEPPRWATITENVREILDRYRDVCRAEQQLEALEKLGEATQIILLKSRQLVRAARGEIIGMVLTISNIAKGEN